MFQSGKKVLIALFAVVFAVSGYYSYIRWIRKPPLPDGLVLTNGRIEGDLVAVASKFPGRIKRLLVREGANVVAGQKLAELDDDQARAKAEQAYEAVSACEDKVRSESASLGVLKEEVPLTIKAAGAGVAHAEAQVAMAGATEAQAARDAKRFNEMVLEGAASRRRGEQARLALEEAKSEMASSRSALVQSEKELDRARLGRQEINARQDGLRALKAECGKAAAALVGARSVCSDLTIVAPSPGVVTTRIADEGEVVAEGSPLLEIVDMDRLYLKAYVPERLIGKVRLGLPARIFVDAYPGRHFDAVVRYISSTAEFTPKEVQTRDERVNLVYAVKLFLVSNPGHILTPGMPADALIKWKAGTPWENPRW
ncbi:MAG: efflux RND transporter periplasmic adaptor subunit [Nitrospiraceae bacterium]|nr:efflux RND transporter periplasmic adaptor subunit [Nitrospiraceae bacterium]